MMFYKLLKTKALIRKLKIDPDVYAGKKIYRKISSYSKAYSNWDHHLDLLPMAFNPC